MLAACNICSLKMINYIGVQKYIFGINGLSGAVINFGTKSQIGKVSARDKN